MTQRFDRVNNQKSHIQTLNRLAHIDYKKPGSFSYAELFGVARQLKLPAADAEQFLCRMTFNIVAINYDDHARNTAFMLKGKQWCLAPAYDLAYSYKPDNFTRDDFYSLEKLSPMFTRVKINSIIDEAIEKVSNWSQLALEYEVPKPLGDAVEAHLRLKI